MKITATSTFHESLSTTFIGCKEGINIRKLRGSRAKYCLDYSSSNTHVCGCGFPVRHAAWEAPEGFEVSEQTECGPSGDEYEYGKGYIKFRVTAI